MCMRECTHTHTYTYCVVGENTTFILSDKHCFHGNTVATLAAARMSPSACGYVT